MPEIGYIVRPDTVTEVVTSDPIDLRSIPCWSVTRVTDGMGWHIGKYRSEGAAEAVALVLAKFSDEEMS